jgi:hypothetical protein
MGPDADEDASGPKVVGETPTLSVIIEIDAGCHNSSIGKYTVSSSSVLEGLGASMRVKRIEMVSPTH